MREEEGDEEDERMKKKAMMKMKAMMTLTLKQSLESLKRKQGKMKMSVMI